MTTLPPPTGEIPALSAEEIEALKRKPETTQAKTDDKELSDIRELTERLLSENLTEGGVDIHEIPSTAPAEDEPAPDSMPPERWAMTNRPPRMEDMAEIHVALQRKPAVPPETSSADDAEKKTETTAGTQTAFCAEGSEE